MVKIHLDTDIGGDPDDLCALTMLLKWPHVQLTGITTVSDDNGIRAGYTRYVLKLVGREDISVKAGTDISEGRYRPIPDETIHPEGKKTRVVTKVEREKFNELWLKTVTTS